MDDLKDRLLAVDGLETYRGHFETRLRNPDGPEAAARIAELEAMLGPDFAPLTNAALRARIATLEALVKEAGVTLFRVQRDLKANGLGYGYVQATLARIKENSREP